MGVGGRQPGRVYVVGTSICSFVIAEGLDSSACEGLGSEQGTGQELSGRGVVCTDNVSVGASENNDTLSLSPRSLLSLLLYRGAASG
jgi:hypothetical protein